MDFAFSEVQEDLRGLARQVLGARATPERLKELEAGRDRVDREAWEDLARTHLLGVPLPEAAGGSGMGVMELCVLLEEVGRHVAPVPLLATVGLGAMPIAVFGSPAQRQRWLPGVVEGKTFLTAALHEPACDDPRAPATRAVREGGGWRLEGEKVAVPWAPLAERILVPARTGPGSVGVFLVDPGAEGVLLEPAEATHREPQGTLRLQGAACGPEDLLGPPEGGEVAAWLWRHGVAGLCATAVGVLGEALRMTAAYVSEREQFGRPLGTFQAVAQRIADAYIDVQAAWVTTWSAVWRLASGRPCDDELSIAKFWVAEGGQRVVHACQHLHGGIGMDVDYPFHRYFLWAKELELALGGASAHLLHLAGSLEGA